MRRFVGWRWTYGATKRAVKEWWREVTWDSEAFDRFVSQCWDEDAEDVLANGARISYGPPASTRGCPPRQINEEDSPSAITSFLGINPLFDPEVIDPEGLHLRGLVEAMSFSHSILGTVCHVYGLCGHPLCAASYSLWRELERARQALNL